MTMKNLLPSSWSRSNSICFTLSSRASRVFFSAGVSPLFASASAAAASAFFLAASLAASFSRLRASFAAFFSALDGGARNAGSPNVSTYLPKHSKPAVAGRGEGSCVARFQRPGSHPAKLYPAKYAPFEAASVRPLSLTCVQTKGGRGAFVGAARDATGSAACSGGAPPIALRSSALERGFDNSSIASRILGLPMGFFAFLAAGVADVSP